MSHKCELYFLSDEIRIFYVFVFGIIPCNDNSLAMSHIINFFRITSLTIQYIERFEDHFTGYISYWSFGGTLAMSHIIGFLGSLHWLCNTLVFMRNTSLAIYLIGLLEGNFTGYVTHHRFFRITSLPM